MIDIIAFIHIHALLEGRTDPDDIKDVIVEYYMNDRHFTDQELDNLYEEYRTYLH